MNLFEQARQDLSFTIEDENNGFGRRVIFEKKNGQRYGENGEIIAKVTDIGFFVDPGSDVGVQGRTVWMEFSLLTLNTLGIGIPKLKDGWKIFYDDVLGVTWKFSIVLNPVDRDLGIVKLNLKLLDVS